MTQASTTLASRRHLSLLRQGAEVVLTPVRLVIGSIVQGVDRAMQSQNDLGRLKSLTRLSCTMLTIGRNNPELASLILSEAIDNEDAQLDVDELKQLVEEAILQMTGVKHDPS